MLRVDALATEGASLFADLGKHRAGVLVKSFQHWCPELRLA